MTATTSFYPACAVTVVDILADFVNILSRNFERKNMSKKLRKRIAAT